eukprot:Skav218697  [mRNA]  locus=scaffold1346:227635:232409:- [translate_table: standard]
MPQLADTLVEPAPRSTSSEQGTISNTGVSAACGTGTGLGLSEQVGTEKEPSPGSTEHPKSVNVPGSKASTVDPHSWWLSSFRILLSTHGSLAAFWKSFHRKPGTSREGSTASMWPMPVPYPRCMSRSPSSEPSESFSFEKAVNLVVVCLNWLHLRRPNTCPEEITLFRPLNKLQWRVVRTLEGCMDAWKVCSPISSADMGRTAGKVETLELAIGRLSTFVASSHEAISRLPDAGSGFPFKRFRGQFTSGLYSASPGEAIGSLPGEIGQAAKVIEADRLEFKGYPVFDPSPFLDEETRYIYQFPLLAASDPQDLHEPIPVVKVHGSKSEVWALLKKLDDSGRLGVIKHHQKVHGFEAGLFSVLKDGSCDRLIFDSRPFNLLESPPNKFIATMASGSNLVDMQIGHGETCIFSSTDLKEFYYSFAASPQRVVRNALKITAWASEIRGFKCYDPSLEHETKPISFGLRTMAMGDRCAVEVAQTAHLSILVQLGLCCEDNVICHDMSVPRSLTSLGVVIDDLVLFQRIASSVLSSSSPPPLESVEMLEAALARYRELGLLPHDGKTIRGETLGEFWGALFDGKQGYVRASLKRVIPILFITLGVIKLGICSIGLLEMIIGSWTAAFLFRRRMLSLFSTCYAAVQISSDRTTVIRMSSELKEELFLCCALGPLAATFLKAPNSQRLYASDASSWGLGVVSTPLPEWFRGEIHRHRLRKSVWCKLLSPLTLQRMKGLLPPADELPEGAVLPSHPLHMSLASCLPFELDSKKSLTPGSHINVKELKGMIEAESIQARREFPSRMMCLGDSQVACAVWVKGRGSSIALNQELQQSLPLHLGCGMISHAGYVPSELNPADDPTRHVEIRSPASMKPPWLTFDSSMTEEERFRLFDAWLLEYSNDPFSISGIPSFHELLRSWDADLPLDQGARSKRYLRKNRTEAKIRRARLGKEKRNDISSQVDVQPSPLRVEPQENSLSSLLSSEALSVLKLVPKSCFLFPKGWTNFSISRLRRRGYLDLYSGKKGVAQKVCDLGQIWAVCFELEDDPCQDLSLESNRKLVLELIRVKAVIGVGSAIFCASFSRAVRPPVRSKDFPAGKPGISAAMEEKVSIGNSHSSFNSEVYETCKSSELVFWIENPDGSFLWWQDKWIHHGANIYANCLRLDYCMLGCPWRKRTRIFSNTHLAGQTLFCSRDHPHRRLVGWSRLHRKSWTKVAQVYPRKLCFSISCAILIDSGLITSRRRVSIASVAKQSHGRIGEAANPGPRRSRSAPRNVWDLSGSLLVESSTEALGSRIWEAFRRWSLSHLSDESFDLFVSVPQILCELLESFGYHLFEQGASIYLMRQLLTYVQRSHPIFRPHLGKAWQLVSKWEALEPIKHRTPLPAVVYRAMVVVAVSWGWRKFAAILVIGFEGICRPGEPLAATRSDLLLPSDLIAEDPSAVRWDAILTALGIPQAVELTPASLRPGGAVKSYREDIEMSKLLWRMRLRNLDTLQHYLQEIGAMTVVHQLPTPCLKRIQFCSELFETFLSATPFSVD